MNRVEDVFDDDGNVIFMLDYEMDGYYILLRGSHSKNEVVKRSRSIVELVQHVCDTYPGKPKLIFSDVCEINFSLQISEGREWWHEMFGEECSEVELDDHLTQDTED